MGKKKRCGKCGWFHAGWDDEEPNSVETYTDPEDDQVMGVEPVARRTGDETG